MLVQWTWCGDSARMQMVRRAWFYHRIAGWEKRVRRANISRMLELENPWLEQTIYPKIKTL